MVAAAPCASRRSLGDSLKVLEADIQHANTLASDFSPDYDGACLQMRMPYGPATHTFLFLLQWTDCSLAGALGLLRIPFYKNLASASIASAGLCGRHHNHVSTHERKPASRNSFYAVIFPSLMQLEHGISDTDAPRQRVVCSERYRRRDGEGEDSKRPVSEIDAKIE